MLRHQWLPDVVRLALQLGMPERAQEAVRLLSADGEVPGMIVGTSGLAWLKITGDPEPVLTAVAHYRAAGRLLKQAKATEDAAILLAESGQLDDARTAFRTALTAYTGMGAVWDVRRAESRMQPFGIRRAGSVRTRAVAGE